MVRLNIFIAICLICLVGAQEETDSLDTYLRTLFCTDYDCGDAYEPVCIFYEDLNCYLTLKNNCDVLDFWCKYISFSKF